MYVADDQTMSRSYAENRRVLERGFERDFAALKGRKVFIAAFIPEQQVNVPRTLAMQQFFAHPMDVSVSRAVFDQRQKYMRTLLNNLANRYRFSEIDVGSKLCNPFECIASQGGTPLYIDDSHLSKTTAIELRYLFSPVFR